MLARRRRTNLISHTRKFATATILAAAATLTLSACGNSGPDVSAEGQIDYACALIDDVKENQPSVEGDWSLRIGDQTDPAMLKVMAAASFAGGGTGGGAPVSEGMQGAAKDIFAGIASLNAEKIKGGVDVCAGACAAR